MPALRYSSIDDYVTRQEPAKAQTLQAVIDYILADFPELEAKIAWNVPTIHRAGKYVAGIDAFKNHLTFAAFSPHIIAAFRDRLENYVVLKNCFHIPVDWQIDRDLIRDMVKARLAELDAGLR